MVKLTLLEMVQNILSAIDSDEVNSISDTTESLQVAEVVKETFYEQFTGVDLPEFKGLIQLASVSDVDSPNYLKLPTNVSELQWVKYKNYRNSSKFQTVSYCTPEEFLERQLHLGAEDTTTLTTDPSGVQYYVKNNKVPERFTIFDDLYLATDSYDSESESVLQSSNTIAYGLKTFEFTLSDDFIPPIDATLFPLLLAEAKSTCFVNLKQISSSKEEQRARRQRVKMQDKLSRLGRLNRYWRNSYARQR